jgi:DNA-directed RNA polymerase specialized sigma24 family protein
LKFELLRRLYRYVPSRARLLAFVVPTLNYLAANLSRKLRAEGRRQRRQARLDPEYLDQVGSQRSTPRCDNDLLDLIRDVQGCIGNLPSELRPLAMLLRALSKSDAAGVLGLPRTSLYPALRKIRRRFEERDLGEYMG